ncbi:ABC transporter ATP-binding protein [Tritonibacter horizontis]|uniref:Oligopeptide transport ATP-binding protein OppF n=1 Tax=Tritonibacter horizontis TaxID=1768241 RepID=A0A132BUQ2_9RHOB|nr:ATP-binding cassette domain-containing protein [Tritonibacter horizontis]KUP91470.1 oligopeptide transport ATP-binding protein OppF [Tritonibacter horizontis]
MLSDPPILSLDRLTKTFTLRPIFGRATQVEALRAVSLDLLPGRALALVGESGSGKSTVGRMIVGHHAPTSGRILFEGRDIAELTRRGDQMRYRQAVQMVFQDPFSALNPAHTIRHHLQRALSLHQPEADPETALREILDDVDLDPVSTPSKFPHELSGGQRQRVNFARALAVRARLIVADEPTSMLDVSIRKSILALMQRLKTEHGLSILYITHDIATAEYLAEDTAVMFRGQVVEKGPTAQVVGAPQHGYTRLLRAAVPDPSIRLTGSDAGFAQDARQVRAASAAAVRGMTEVSTGHFIADHAAGDHATAETERADA